MKRPDFKRALALAVTIAGGIICGSCRPSVHEVADIVSTVPIGASREQVREALVQAYSKRFPHFRHDYGLVDDPQPLSDGVKEADKRLLAGGKRRGSFTLVYPADLFDKLPSKAYYDMVGLVAEAAEGNGDFSIYYDDKTNYIGFFTSSSERIRKIK